MSSRIVMLPVIAFFILGSALAQDFVPDPEFVHPNQQANVSNLAVIKAPDESKAAVAKTALAIVLSAEGKTCDTASHVYTVLEANGNSSLRELSGTLAGASCLMKGRTVHLGARFTPNGSIQADDMIAPILHGKPLLIRWNDEVYVLYGVVYDEHLHNSGKSENVIRRLLLIDPRHSVEQRLVLFDRQKDDFAQVEGIAEIVFAIP